MSYNYAPSILDWDAAVAAAQRAYDAAEYRYALVSGNYEPGDLESLRKEMNRCAYRLREVKSNGRDFIQFDGMVKRFTAQPQFRSQISSDGIYTLIGYASTTGTDYTFIDENHRKVTENITPGAFLQSLSEGPDVDLVLEHDRSKYLASTVDDSLKLSEDSKGFKFVATLTNPDPELVDEMRSCKGCSFLGQFTGYELDGVNYVTSVDLNGGDVTLTANPANGETVWV